MKLRHSKPLLAGLSQRPMSRVRFIVFLTSMLAILATTLTAFALERAADGYFHTGATIREKRFVIKVKVYSLGHMMKELPEQKTIQGVIDMDTDKTFVLAMLRDVSGDKMSSAIKEAFAANGYTDAARISKFTGVFGEEVKEKDTVRISYSSATKTTTASVSGGKSVSIDGDAFMKAMWSCFMKNPEQPSMGTDLISKIK